MSDERWTRAAARGVAWGMAASVTSRLLWLLATAVLARLLAPAEFGLWAIGLVVVLYLETVGDLGFSSALIQSREEEEVSAQAAFTVNLVLGALWCATLWSLAGPIAEAMREPGAAPVLRALAPAFLLKALGATHDALCQKRLRFRDRFVPEAAMAAVKSGVAVALALSGLGVWALVVAQLAGQAVWAALLWRIVPWRTRAIAPRRETLARLFLFGRWIVVVNVLAAVVHHADKLVVGRELGAAALGLYQMAAKVIEVSITVWIWVLGRVLFPAFAQLHARGEPMAPAYLRAVRGIALVTLPGAAVLAIAARPVVITLFGGAWSGAAPILAALALAGAFRSLGSSAGDALKSTGASGTLAALASIKGALLVPALIFAAPRGAPAIALAMAAVAGTGLAIDSALVGRRLGVRAGEWARAVAPGLAVAAATAAVAGAVAALSRGAPEPARLAMIALAASVPALLGLARFEPGLWRAARGRLVAGGRVGEARVA